MAGLGCKDEMQHTTWNSVVLSLTYTGSQVRLRNLLSNKPAIVTLRLPSHNTHVSLGN
jgi:hypothetical protein